MSLVRSISEVLAQYDDFLDEVITHEKSSKCEPTSPASPAVSPAVTASSLLDCDSENCRPEDSEPLVLLEDDDDDDDEKAQQFKSTKIIRSGPPPAAAPSKIGAPGFCSSKTGVSPPSMPSRRRSGKFPFFRSPSKKKEQIELYGGRGELSSLNL